MRRRTIPLVVALLAVLAASAAAAAPEVRAVLDHGGPQITGPHTWRPGWQSVTVTSRVNDQELTLIHFRAGYSYARLLADGSLAPGRTPAAHAALRRVFTHTVFDGGANLFRGQSATVDFHVAPGTYYLGEMTTHPQFERIRVTGAAAAAPPAASGTIVATDASIQVSGALPAGGTITIDNTGRHNHRVNLIPVQNGTTRAELGAYLRKHGMSESAPPPPFALDGPQIGTADLSAGVTMQLGYRLPAGTYAVIDLDQDPLTGHPQALDGMYTVVTLR